MFLWCTLGGDFDIFAASGESTAWVPFWKTRSRPIGVRVCPVAPFDFFSTAFDPRAWTMVVFWKEDSGDLVLNHKIRQIRQITLDFDQDYLQLLHLRVEKEQERWIDRVNDRVRDQHHLSPNLFTLQ